MEKTPLPCALLHYVTCGNSEVFSSRFPSVFLIVPVRLCTFAHKRYSVRKPFIIFVALGSTQQQRGFPGDPFCW